MIRYKTLYKFFVWFLFISFLVLYFAQANGYYEELNKKKVTLTNEKIKEFEEDVKNGKEIKVENYMIEEKKDYSNKISDFGLYTSNFFAKYFKKGINLVFSNIDKAVNE